MSNKKQQIYEQLKDLPLDKSFDIVNEVAYMLLDGCIGNSYPKQPKVVINLNSLIDRVDVSVRPESDENEIRQRLGTLSPQLEKCLLEAILNALKAVGEHLPQECPARHD